MSFIHYIVQIILYWSHLFSLHFLDFANLFFNFFFFFDCSFLLSLVGVVVFSSFLKIWVSDIKKWYFSWLFLLLSSNWWTQCVNMNRLDGAWNNAVCFLLLFICMFIHLFEQIVYSILLFSLSLFPSSLSVSSFRSTICYYIVNKMNWEKKILWLLGLYISNEWWTWMGWELI